MLYSLGWFGAERIWYLRIFRNEPIAARELLRFTRVLFGRYLRLALLCMLFGLPLIALTAGTDYDPGRTPLSVRLTHAAVVVVVHVLLTFVAPALAFSTASVRQAFRIGLGLLREQWPHCMWYAAVPPLAILLMYVVNYPSTAGAAILSSSGGALLNVWFKGATAAFYLRRVSVGRDGAAFATTSDGSADSSG